MVGRIAHRRTLRLAQGPQACGRPGEKVLSVQNLSMGNVVRNTSFSVFAGQITGVFGLIGSGRTETAKVVAGVLKRDLFHGGAGPAQRTARALPRAAPGRARRHHLRHRGPQDRRLLRDHVDRREHLPRRRWPAGRHRSADRQHERDASARASSGSSALNIKAINGDARVIELSGGNQQKVVVAKALVQKPKLIIFDEPTRGVDVGAIAEIHQLINRLADEGIAVMVISSYLPEVLQLSDRILVCRQGRIVEEFDGPQGRRGNHHVRGGALMGDGAQDHAPGGGGPDDRGYRRASRAAPTTSWSPRRNLYDLLLATARARRRTHGADGAALGGPGRCRDVSLTHRELLARGHARREHVPSPRPGAGPRRRGIPGADAARASGRCCSARRWPASRARSTICSAATRSSTCSTPSRRRSLSSLRASSTRRAGRRRRACSITFRRLTHVIVIGGERRGRAGLS